MFERKLTDSVTMATCFIWLLC